MVDLSKRSPQLDQKKSTSKLADLIPCQLAGVLFASLYKTRQNPPGTEFVRLSIPKLLRGTSLEYREGLMHSPALYPTSVEYAVISA